MTFTKFIKSVCCSFAPEESLSSGAIDREALKDSILKTENTLAEGVSTIDQIFSSGNEMLISRTLKTLANVVRIHYTSIERYTDTITSNETESPEFDEIFTFMRISLDSHVTEVAKCRRILDIASTKSKATPEMILQCNKNLRDSIYAYYDALLKCYDQE